MESVEARVRSILSKLLGISGDEIKPESKFVGDLEADSLDIVEVITALESEFELEISDDDAEKVVTVRDAVNYIEAHL